MSDPDGPLARLRSVALLSGVPDSQLQTVAGRLRPVVFAAGETIVREGDSGNSWYVLDSGRAVVVSRDLAGLPITLAEFEPGAHFGEVALVTGGRRSATVQALEVVTALVLDRGGFEELEDRCPEFAARIRQHVDLLAVDTFLRKASPFARLPDESIRRLAGQLRHEHARPGETIIREGEQGDRFYLVRSGSVEVLHGDRLIQTLGPGDFFGEVALLAAVPRTATVRAATYTQLLSLAKHEFDAVVALDSAARRQMAEVVRIRAGDALARTIAAVDPLIILMPELGGHRRRRYWRLLAGGLALFAVLSLLAALTEAPLVVLGALITGAFVGPVVYVVYLAEAQLLPERPFALAVTFLLAAALGIPVATFVGQALGAGHGSLAAALLVGLVEEPAKALGVAWVLWQARSRFQMDGLVYGAAAGMGFAAFENVLYGWSTAGSSVPDLLSALWLRTVLSPFSHGTWTAIICAAVWRAKGSGKPRLDLTVAAAFALSVLLHGLWNWQPVEGPALVLWFSAIGVVGLLALRRTAGQASREAAAAVLALNPEAAASGYDEGEQIRCGACGQTAPPGTHYCARCGAALRAEV